MWLFGAGPEEATTDAIARLIRELSSTQSTSVYKSVLSELENLATVRANELSRAAITPLLCFCKSRLQDSSEDVELLQLALNVILTLVNPPPGTQCVEHSSDQDMNNFQSSVLTSVTELACKENIAHLLSLVGCVDYVARYNVIQIYTICLVELGSRIRKLTLEQPMGINRLKELINDDRDMIRTTVFLLLVHLTEDSPTIQNIVAFDTFPVLLQIAKEEGWVRGGTIVQDITLLLSNLLTKNLRNQRLFVTQGELVSGLGNLLDLPEQADGQEILIVSRVIGIVRELSRNKETLDHLHPLSLRLLQLTTSHHLSRRNLGPNDSDELLTKFTNKRLDCLEAFAAIIVQNEKVVENFPGYTISISHLDNDESNPEWKVLRVNRQITEYFLDIAVGSPPCAGLPCPHVREVRLARTVLESYLRDNNQGQILFASMILNSQQGSESHFGRLLGEILFFSGENEDALPNFGDPEKFGTAISILTAILLNNQDVKLMFLDLKIKNDKTLVEIISQALLQAIKHKSALSFLVGLFRVLCTWCENSEKTIQTLFEKSPDLWELVVLLPGQDDMTVLRPLLRGLPCILLAYCCDYPQALTFGGPPGFIRDVIQRRVGLDKIKTRLQDLVTALSEMKGSTEPAAQFFDDPFVQNIEDLLATLDSRYVKLLSSNDIMKSESKTQQHDDGTQIARLKSVEEENWKLKQKLTELQKSKKEKKKKMKELVAKLLETSHELDRCQKENLGLEVLLQKQRNEIDGKKFEETGETLASPSAQHRQSDLGQTNPAILPAPISDSELRSRYTSLQEEHEDLLVLVSDMDDELLALRKEKLEATFGVSPPHPRNGPNHHQINNLAPKKDSRLP